MSQGELLAFLRFTIAWIFLFSSIAKVLTFKEFRLAIVGFDLVSRPRITLVAASVIVAEIAVIPLMVVGRAGLAIGFGLVIVLTAAFTVVLARAIRLRQAVACNCFGRSDRQVSSWDLGRNVLIVLAAVTGLWLLAQDAVSPTGWTAALLAAMGLGVTVLLTNLQDVAEVLKVAEA